MRKSFTTVLIASFLATGCASNRGSTPIPPSEVGQAQALQADAATNPLIPSRVGVFGGSREQIDPSDLSTPIASITELRIERLPGGAIIRATGVDQIQDAFNVRLVPGNAEELPVDGVLAYTMERQRLAEPTPMGAARTREVVVARKLTDNQLRGVRSIRVQAAQNALSVRR